MGTILSLVAAGLGISLVPDSLCDTPFGAVVYRRLADVEEITELVMAYRRSEASPAARAFIRQAQAFPGVGDHLVAPRAEALLVPGV